MRRCRSSSNSGTRPWLAAGAALILCGQLAGCLLQTRPDEGPPGGNPNDQANWAQPVALGIALGNIKRALEAQQRNLTNYGNSFSDTGFELIIDPADESELGGNPFTEWSATLEEQRMTGILSSVSAKITLTWTPRDSIDYSSSVRYYQDLVYRLKFEESTRSVTYSGKADVWFTDDGQGQYFITKWVDKRDGSPNRTWGWLRARNQLEF